MKMYRLTVGRAEAVVSARAAALRVLRIDGVDLVEPTLSAGEPPEMAGAVLAPWPNRTESARWWHGGRQQRLAVTEPSLGHAIHGLLTGVDLEVEAVRVAELELLAVLDSPPGYPFRLEVRVRYRLRPDGLDLRFDVHNVGNRSAPVALGAHPYFRIGDVDPAALRVRIDADTAYRLDERHIPREAFPVAGRWDLRAGRPVPELPGHATFAHLGPARELHHAIEAPDGRRVHVRADPAFRWTQLYLAENFPSDDGPRTAIALEPMTAPPNGLRTGTGLRMLSPGARWRPGFRIRLR
jgi:aldose 1-epimerase